MTKILQTADTHLGKKQYRSDTRRSDFADAFDAVVDIAIEEGVDAVLHCGDLFDDPTPNLETFNRCLDAVKRLDESDIPFYAIVGNHERKRDTQWMDIVERFGNDDRRLSKSPTVVTNDDGEDPVVLYGIDAVRKPEWDNTDFTLEPPRVDAPTILAMHELFQPIVPEHKGNPYDINEVLDRLNTRPDALALGDFHSTTSETVRDVDLFYPGATERCKVNETGKPSVYIVESDGGTLTRRIRTVKSANRPNTPREFIVVDVTFEPGHGIGHVEQRVREESASYGGVEDSVVVVRMYGEDVPVTASEVHGLLTDLGAAVPHVDDKRVAQVSLDFDEDEDVDIDNVEQLVEDAVGELDLSSDIARAEDLIRNGDIDTSDVRARITDQIQEAQEEKFGEATVEK